VWSLGGDGRYTLGISGVIMAYIGAWVMDLIVPGVKSSRSRDIFAGAFLATAILPDLIGLLPIMASSGKSHISHLSGFFSGVGTWAILKRKV